MLVGCNPTPPKNWHQFLTRWNRYAEDGDLFAMLGALHEGWAFYRGSSRYGEPEYDAVDRVVFYLGIADNWRDDHRNFGEGVSRRLTRYVSGKEVHETQNELSQRVAKKAFEILCHGFFRLTESDDRWPSREITRTGRGEIASERLFSALTDFFRVEDNMFGRLRVRNLPEDTRVSHGEGLARSFLLNMVGNIWEWKEEEIKSWLKQEENAKVMASNISTRDRLEKAKPWTIDVLSLLGSLGVLYQYELDDASLKHIRDIAMQTEMSRYTYPVSTDRRVVTLDEACFAGSQAAIFLRTYESNRAERRRLQAVLDAERRLENAKRDVEKLSGKK